MSYIPPYQITDKILSLVADISEKIAKKIPEIQANFGDYIIKISQRDDARNCSSPL